MCAELKMNNQLILLSKQQIEDSLLPYNPIHLTTIDFDHPIHLLHQVNTMEELQYIFGIIASVISIYYFAVEIFNHLKRT
jgi:hypothetical protein|uniref:Uncharacterized protein n=1 Tax=viral metagenome TaxID=1070528 RepID=A0A6C0CY14_9ZZZZ